LVVLWVDGKGRVGAKRNAARLNEVDVTREDGLRGEGRREKRGSGEVGFLCNGGEEGERVLTVCKRFWLSVVLPAEGAGWYLDDRNLQTRIGYTG